MREGTPALTRSLDDQVCPDPCGCGAPTYLKLTISSPAGMEAEMRRTFTHRWDEEEVRRPAGIGIPRFISTRTEAEGQVFIPAGVYYFMLTNTFENNAGVCRAAYTTRDLSSIATHGNTHEQVYRTDAQYVSGSNGTTRPIIFREAGANNLTSLQLVIQRDDPDDDWIDDGKLLRITINVQGYMREGKQATGGGIDWESSVAGVWNSVAVFGTAGIPLTPMVGDLDATTDPGCGYLAYDREAIIVGYAERINPTEGSSGPSDTWPPGLDIFESNADWTSFGSVFVVGTVEDVTFMGTDVATSTKVLAEPTYGAVGADVQVDVVGRTNDPLSHPRVGSTRYNTKLGTLSGGTISLTWTEGYPDWALAGRTPDNTQLEYANDSSRASQTTFTFDEDVYILTGDRQRAPFGGTSVTWGGTPTFDRTLYRVCSANAFPSHHQIYRESPSSTIPVRTYDIWAENIPPCHTAWRQHFVQLRSDPGGWYPNLPQNSSSLGVDGVCEGALIPTYPDPDDPEKDLEFQVRICLPEDTTNNGGCGGGAGFGDAEGGDCTTELENLGLCGDNDPDAGDGSNGRGEAGGDLNSGSPFDDGPLGDIDNQCDYYPNPHPLRPCFCVPPPTEPYIPCGGDVE